MSAEEPLPVGKLPQHLLAALLASLPAGDPRVVVRPGVGEDVTAIDMGARYLVAKTDPITFTESDIGSYLAHVNANDIATSGARPRWCLVTALLPEGRTTPALARRIFDDLAGALGTLGVSLVGGHTEITSGLDRPILVGAMLGEVDKDRLVDKRRAGPGDAVLMTKFIPLEGAALIARDRAGELAGDLTPDEIARAAAYLRTPGLSILPDAEAATGAARIHAMHDVTEGGLATGLAELAVATNTGLEIDAALVRIDPLGARICRRFGLDPLGLISSGTLLIVTAPEDAARVSEAVRAAGVPCAEIGWMTDQAGLCRLRRADGTLTPLPRFAVDELARLMG